MKRPGEEEAEAETGTVLAVPPPKKSRRAGGAQWPSRGGKGEGGRGLGNPKRCAFKVLCTDPFAANLIGPKGSTRSAIEQEANCCLWISKRDELFPKPAFRLLILHADEPSQVLVALEMLVPKLVEVAEKGREVGEDSPLIGKVDGEYVMFVALPTLVRGKLLGTRGANIQELREKTGAKIFVENEAFEGHQSARIIGSPETINYVLGLLNEMVQEEAGTEEFAAWTGTRTFGGEHPRGGGRGDRGDRESRGKGGEHDRDRGGGRRGQRQHEGQYHHRDHSPDPDDRATRPTRSARVTGPPFPEIGAPPLDAMGGLARDFQEGSLDLDHAISCELPRADVNGLLGPRHEHLAFLQQQTGTMIELTEVDSFCKILIMGPLLATYLAHFLLMKKFHDNNAPLPDVDGDRVEELKAQLAELQNQLENVQRGAAAGGGGRPAGGPRR